MVVGFNHNFRYKDVLYHVQTEDGGIKNPVIITHLFDGGTILATKKTSYADILKSERLEQVVEDLMKDQHREMLRCLRKGEFDAVIARLAAGTAAARRPAEISPAPEPAGKVPPPAPAAASGPAPEVQPPPAERPPAPVPPASVPPPVGARPPAPPSSPAPCQSPPPPPSRQDDLADRVFEKSLDDIILSYLLGEDKSA